MEKIMKVKLISYSQPTEEVKAEGLEDVQDLIAFCARVSNPSNQYNSETSEKLLNYLAKHAHWSPFEMVSACLEIETTRDIARQILRHRSFSFQEFSQRYADPTKDLDFEAREARFQDPKNRQNSIDLDPELEAHVRINEQFRIKQMKLIREVRELYQWAINFGIAKEQARAVLPEGLTMSRMYMNGTIRSWIHFINLRSGNGTQKEHMEIAREIAKVIANIFPLAESYVNNN
jgi:thymidylate synthase (FAD)